MRSLLSGLFCALLALAAPSFAREPAPLSAYGDLPGVEMMALAPGGARIAVISRIKDQRQLVVIENGKALSSSPISDLKVRGLRWAGDDLLMIGTSVTFDMPFGFTTSKAELFAEIITHFDGAKPDHVFASTPSMSSAIFGEYGIRRINGKWTGFFSGIKYKKSADRTGWEFDHGRPALFAVDLTTNHPSVIAGAPNEGHWLDWLIDAEGRVAVSLDLAENGNWTIKNAQGTRLAYGADPNGSVSLVSLGKDADTVIYALNDREAGATRWFETSLGGGNITELFANIGIERSFIDPNSGALLGYLNEDEDEKRPVFFDAAHQAKIEKLYRAFPNLELTIVDWTPDFNKFIVLVRGNGDSGTYYSVDMANRKAEPLGYERPMIFADQVGPISTVSYKAGDGLDLDGILTLPPGLEPKNLPIIMLPHGGPGSEDVETFDWWAQAFASRGYAVFQPNFRGSTNRGLAFQSAGDGQWGRKMQSDISDGLAELAKRGIADPERACIMGASYGGYAALAGVTLQQGLYRCAVAVAPVSDLKDMYWTNYSESGRSKMLRRNYLQALGDREKFEEVSPRRHADKADAPILLIHGKDDTVVAFDQSSRMADALKSAGKPYEFVVLREEDHWLSKSATRKQMLEEAMRFVQQYNPAH